MTFKIGDKVRYLIDNPNMNVYVGYIGTVLDIVPESDYWYYVEFTTISDWFYAGNLELKTDEL